jgi:chromosome segregation ATPase
MVLNYFLSTRQESEAEKASRAFEGRLNDLRRTLETSHATSVEELMESHRSALEKARAASEGRLQALKDVYAKDRAEREKKLLTLEKDLRNSTKLRNGLIVSLAMAEDDASGVEEEVVELEESNVALKDALGEKYAEGFTAALEQIKVLFPGLDEATFNRADMMKVIEDGELVTRVPVAGNSGEVVGSQTSPEP